MVEALRFRSADPDFRKRIQIWTMRGNGPEVRDRASRPHFLLNGREPNYYSVPVPQGQDGRIWCVRYGKGAIRLLTVPPCFATTPQGLLLPKEVVEKDAPNP
jgi:hypothetical protein